MPGELLDSLPHGFALRGLLLDPLLQGFDLLGVLRSFSGYSR